MSAAVAASSAGASAAQATPLPPTEFDAGVVEFADALRAFVRHRIHDPADADDVAQDVFVRVFRARTSLRDPRKLRAWLYQAARAAIIDHYRRRRPREALPEELPEDVEHFDEVGERLRRAVRRFLATLPEHYRRPLLLADFQGKSVAEIAGRLNLSPTATKSRLARGRALLRRKLLECCRFEFDRFGRAIDLHQKHPCDCAGPEGTRPQPVSYRQAQEEDEPAIRGLLQFASLPTEDITSAHLLNFVVARHGHRVVGCAGVEVYGTDGLLRSVAVAPDWRGREVGRHLVDEAQTLAWQMGVRRLFLLTTTAEHFFRHLGYTPAARRRAPAAIRQTREFASLCPSTAVFMHRKLQRPTSAHGCECC